jgi:hypothetical protein
VVSNEFGGNIGNRCDYDHRLIVMNQNVLAQDIPFLYASTMGFLLFFIAQR